MLAGSNGVGTNNSGQLNMFTDPETVIKSFRRCVLGYDTSCGGYYNLRNRNLERGLPPPPPPAPFLRIPTVRPPCR